MNKRKRLFFNMTLFFSVVLISFTVAETLLRIGYPSIADYNSEMWRYSTEIKYPTEIGHEHRPHVRGFYYGTEIKTNSEGWRDREFPLTKTNYRIMALGDSLTLGWGVEYKDSYPKVLERLLNQKGRAVEVINTGVGNYNTEMEVASFLKKGAKYSPDELIVGYYINDAELVKRTAPWLPELFQQSFFYGIIAGKILNLSYRFRSNATYGPFYSSLYAEGFLGRDKMEQGLSRLGSYCRQSKIPCTVFIIPEMHQFKPYPFAEAHKRVESAAVRAGLRVFDLTEAFTDQNPESLWVSHEDAHPNRQGQQIIATSMFERLSETVSNSSPQMTRMVPLH